MLQNADFSSTVVPNILSYDGLSALHVSLEVLKIFKTFTISTKETEVHHN